MDTIATEATITSTNHSANFVESLSNHVNELLAITVYPSCTTDEVATISDHSDRISVGTKNLMVLQWSYLIGPGSCALIFEIMVLVNF